MTIASKYTNTPAQDWRQELQQQLDINNEMRAMSLRRIGDSVSERPSQSEWVGRVREVERVEK